MEQRTTQSILDSLEGMVRSKTPISPEEWVDAALFLEILKGSENDKLLSYEMIANQKKVELRATCESNADAKMYLEASEEWKQFRKQKMLLDHIQEFVRLAKKQAEIRKI